MQALKKNDLHIYLGGKILLPSRFFLAPINTGFAKRGEPTDDLIQFHNERSGKGIGISYVGNVAIDPALVTNNSNLYFSDNNDNWNKLSEIISRNGSIPGIQLACRSSKLTPPQKWINRRKNDYIEAVRAELSSYSQEFLLYIIQKFIASAKASYKLGFRVIQIHAAHGYLLSQLLSSSLNVRSDIFGYDKLFILRSIIEGIRKDLPDAIIDVRLSIIEDIQSKEHEFKQKEDLIDEIVRVGVEIISISNGFYDINKQFIYPPKKWGHGVYVNMSMPYVQKYKNVIWNIAGNIWNLKQLPGQIPENCTFSIGRSLIADSDFVIKSLQDNDKSIISCDRFNVCHYYSRGLKNIACPVNATLKVFEDKPK